MHREAGDARGAWANAVNMRASIGRDVARVTRDQQGKLTVERVAFNDPSVVNDPTGVRVCVVWCRRQLC